MALLLFRLTQYEVAEIKRGRCGLGTYILRSGLTPVDPQTSDSVVPSAPSAIVERVVGGMTLPASDSTPSVSSIDSMSVSDPRTASVTSDSSEHAAAGYSSVEHTASENDTQSSIPSTSSTVERAKHVVSSGLISLDVKLAVFTVVGTTEPRVVRRGVYPPKNRSKIWRIPPPSFPA
jgi:hypothetical protein